MGTTCTLCRWHCILWPPFSMVFPHHQLCSVSAGSLGHLLLLDAFSALTAPGAFPFTGLGQHWPWAAPTLPACPWAPALCPVWCETSHLHLSSVILSVLLGTLPLKSICFISCCPESLGMCPIPGSVPGQVGQGVKWRGVVEGSEL